MPEVRDKYIHIPVRDKADFVSASFRTIDISKPRGIKAVIGKLKSDPQGTTKTQKFLFDKEKWTLSEAQSWVDEHGKTLDFMLGENKFIIFNDEEIEEDSMKTVQQKMYDCECKEFNDDERSFMAVASTEAKDRDGDIIRASGWKLKNFKRNPVILWAHNASMLPIGKAEMVKVDEEKLKFKVKFVPGEIYPFAEQVYQMYKAGFLRAFSVRFDPYEWEDMKSDKPPKPNMRFRFGRDYKSAELLEISGVNIPANPEALKNADYHNLLIKSAIIDNANLIQDDSEREKILKGFFDFEKKIEESDRDLFDRKELNAIIEPMQEKIKELEIKLEEKKVDDKDGDIDIEKELAELDEEIKSLEKDELDDFVDTAQKELESIPAE